MHALRVYAYTYMYSCMYACAYVYIVHKSIFVHMNGKMFRYHVCIYTCAYTVYFCSYACTFEHLRICAYVYV